MCGRFTLIIPPSQLQQQYGTKNAANIAPRYNIAPTQPVAVIRPDVKGARLMDIMYWGLVPSWAKDISIGSKLINARAETLTEKPSFRNAFRRRRCIIPANGFFEWQKPSGQPYYFSSASGPLSLAGLWEHWTSPDGSDLLSCCIVTTEANSTVHPVHGRMPASLEGNAIDQWLSDTEDTDSLTALLTPRESNALQAWKVEKKVNRPANDFPELIEPLAELALA